MGWIYAYFFYGRTELNKGEGGRFGIGQGTIFLVPLFFFFVLFPHVRIRRNGKVNDTRRWDGNTKRGLEGDFGLSLGQEWLR